jgi:hypothetical protein
MPWSFIIPTAVSLIGGSQQAKAAQRAANTTAAATDRANELQQRMYEENVARQKPFYDVGVNALPELVAASKYTNFGMDQFQQDPGYGFRLKEGQKALERNAAARGGLISGGALKAAQQYGQEMGSQEYTNAFNRYQIERNARLNPLQSLAGFGQTSVNQLGQAGQNYASNVGNLMTGGAAAQAGAPDAAWACWARSAGAARWAHSAHRRCAAGPAADGPGVWPGGMGWRGRRGRAGGLFRSPHFA